MAVDRKWVRIYLQQFDFESLFVEMLGWDTVDLDVIPVGEKGEPYEARAIAQKRDMVVYHCEAEAGGGIPSSGARRKIEGKINEYTREHLIVYSDAAQREQVWQWVRREKGKPMAVREYRYSIGQSGELLVQKLEALEIALDEEEALTISDVKKRTKKAFDVDRVTKKFYERFQKEHRAFLKFVTGIQETLEREWYASVMLNRLMFVYFLQKKGFLDGDLDYLQNRLKGCQQGHGDDEFYSFYRYFLLRLFHEGLGNPSRENPELARLIGKIPYLNGGLFDVHELEERNPDIQIPDSAFESIFAFFDEYQWHLDDRPLRDDRQINPDVLGYIFEKYINQKQMGAYYTKEDITEYISKNTIVPFLFDAAKKGCAVAFEPDGPVWRLLKENPEKYIYDAVKKGVLREDPGAKAVVVALPAEIAAGIEDVSKRDGWNRLADAEYALPTELWREHVARRLRCLEIQEKLARGEVHEINDLITYNLNIRQFAQDVIEQCEGPELLRSLYKAISQISVLDPTCGSGAFLFAALNILEPLYEACLQRMRGFVEDLDRSGEKARPEKFSDFRKVLEQIEKHPNREYFILKSIILGNLYGVDIMEEAVEICKLRLFLKLVSQVDAKEEKLNYGLEPLPDIDFNIRAGNTLVGFATYDEVKKAVEGDGQQKLDLFSDMPRINESAEIAARAFQKFKEQQIDYGMDAIRFKDAKVEVKRRLKELNSELNLYLASEYGINVSKSVFFDKWSNIHQPFHWFVEFYRIISSEGFDVIIGNPPYVEYRTIKDTYKIRNYQTEKSGNLYAFSLERSSNILRKNGRLGFIVPVASICTERYSSLQQLLIDSGKLVASSFNDRPGKLFDGLEHIRLSILLWNKRKDDLPISISTTKYNKWQTAARSYLFDCLSYCDHSYWKYGSVSKVGTNIERNILDKILSDNKRLAEYTLKSARHKIYYTRKLSSFVQILDFIPRITNEAGEYREPSELKTLCFASQMMRDVFLSVLNSTLFYWFLTVYSDCRNLNKREVLAIPFDFDKASSSTKSSLQSLSRGLMEDMVLNSEVLEMNYKRLGLMNIQCVYPKLSKEIIDKVDAILSRHYDLTNKEMDFVVNYDIKYRMGIDSFESN